MGMVNFFIASPSLEGITMVTNCLSFFFERKKKKNRDPPTCCLFGCACEKWGGWVFTSNPNLSSCCSNSNYAYLISGGNLFFKVIASRVHTLSCSSRILLPKKEEKKIMSTLDLIFNYRQNKKNKGKNCSVI